jgi:hypothetical protein
MTRLFPVAALPILAVLTFVSTSVLAVPISHEKPRPAVEDAAAQNTPPASNGHAGGNSTNVDSHSYVSPVVGAPPLFTPGPGGAGTGDLPVIVPSLTRPAEVPEPGTLALLVMGLAGLLVSSRAAGLLRSAPPRVR